jgi:hypothetical protein
MMTQRYQRDGSELKIVAVTVLSSKKKKNLEFYNYSSLQRFCADLAATVKKKINSVLLVANTRY